ncbi:MAG: DUF6291 domain-containing protein [Lachnospiraceae bacterium]|nr:DUF6291 domain-containing protein [Lachnospiraceae bacterium]
MEKNSILFYTQWAPGVLAISDEAAGQLFKAIFSGEAPALPEAVALYAVIRPVIDKDTEKYRAKCEQNRLNRAARTMRTVDDGTTGANDGQRSLTVVNDGQRSGSDNDNDNDNESHKREIKEREAPPKPVKRFVKPTLDEVRTYANDKGLVMDCERFWDFYEAKGWKVGSTPMKDWKAAVRNWAREDKSRKAAIPAKNRFQNFTPRSEESGPSALELQLLRMRR